MQKEIVSEEKQKKNKTRIAGKHCRAANARKDLLKNFSRCVIMVKTNSNAEFRKTRSFRARLLSDGGCRKTFENKVFGWGDGMRVFIALELPEKTKDNLARSAEQFRQFATKGRFTERQNYHITLHFLGEVAENDLIYVQSAMDGIKNLPAPIIALHQFSVLRGGDIVCARIRQNGALTVLHDRLGELLEKNGFDAEHRAYRPHITVIRQYGFSLPFSEVTKNVDVFNRQFAATEVVLYRSVPERDGPIYTELYRISLKTDGEQI